MNLPAKDMDVGKRYLFRLDSGNDPWDTLEAVGDRGKGYYCIIKRNKRKESDEMWLKRAKRYGKRAACISAIRCGAGQFIARHTGQRK
jgi:hypothetical protein